MIRVALRQFRTEGIVGFALLAVFGVVLAVTGPHLAHVSAAFERVCKAAGDCTTATNPVLGVDKPLQAAVPFLVLIAPVLVGLFFGAPLIARELETGTFRLAWTQSVTRLRWLAVKFGLVGFAAMAIGGLLSWMTDWWVTPLDALDQNRFGLANFGFHGIVPIGYAAFAFALGATGGVLVRRTVAAMALTGVGFAAVRLLVTYWVRPYLAAPVRTVLPLSAGSGPGFVFGGPHGTMYLDTYTESGLPTLRTGQVALSAPHVTVPNGWVYSTAALDKGGHPATSHALLRACPVLGQISRSIASSSAPVKPHLGACVATLSATYHTVLTYQPASRFWPFQWAETGIFLAGALTLCGIAYWWLRRRYA